ncbi:MAG: tetratricopeptide repeat protein [Bacteroidota bacterium]
MRIWGLTILLMLGFGSSDGPLDRARQLFSEQKYEQSLAAYWEAYENYPNKVEEIRFNLGQCYLRMDSLDQALDMFLQVLTPLYPEIASQASNNIGVIRLERQAPKEALASFRDALVFNPKNETARYNYELLRRRLGVLNPPPKEQQPEEEDTPPDAGNPPPLPDQVDLPGSVRRLLAEIRRRRNQQRREDDKGVPVSDTLSLQEALLFMRHLRMNETQFLQQLRKSPSLPPKRKEKHRPW